jgi:glyoxylase-like metal-dependent hydrolase (beta-lactamase superfamily II)
MTAANAADPTIRHLDCGTMCPAARLTGVDHIVCHVLLIETSDGLVLIDTGYGLGDIADPKGRLGPARHLLKPRLDAAQTALRQVESLGHNGTDVRHIIVTHLDIDHVGGISDFPHATIHVTRAEEEAARTLPSFADKSRYHPKQWAHGPKWNLLDADGEAWFGFAAARQLPGLDDRFAVIPLPVHTRGHAGVAVRTGDGWLLHAGDAYFHRAEVPQARSSSPAGERAPRGLLMFQRTAAVQWKRRCENLERLRELALRHGDEVRIIPAHDAGELAAFGG